jgi:metal-responsive CopG/Arc/MetJ family transcriptional regulator
MFGMTVARKLKVSVSIDADLVRLVDQRAAREGQTRSAIMEAWLRSASRRAAAARLEEETAAYYDVLTPTEASEDIAWAKGSARVARKLTIDDAPHRHSRKG